MSELSVRSSSPQAKAVLAAAFPGVRFEQAGPWLRAQVAGRPSPDTLWGLVDDAVDAVVASDSDAPWFAYHTVPDGFLATLGLHGHVAGDCLEALLVERREVAFRFGPRGLALFCADGDLYGFADALADKVDHGLSAAPPPAVAGRPFPAGTYRAGQMLFEVELDEGRPHVRPVGYRALATLLRALDDADLLGLFDAWARGVPFVHAAGELIPAVGGDRATFALDGRAGDALVLARALELLARARLAPTDGQADVDERTAALRQAHTVACAVLQGSDRAAATPAVAGFSFDRA
jgi:hypothetical protein